MAKQKNQAAESAAQDVDGDVAAVDLAEVGEQTDVGATSAAQPLSQDEPAVLEPHIVQARVLGHCALGEPNDVIEIDAALAATMSDIVDTAPAAVAYALSITKE